MSVAEATQAWGRTAQEGGEQLEASAKRQVWGWMGWVS